MKKIIFTFLIFGLANFLIAQPVVTNGDFELWTASVPDAWTVQTDASDLTYAQGSGLGVTGDALQIIGNNNGSSKDGEFFTSVYVSGIVGGNTYALKVKVKSADDGVKIRFWDTRWYDASDIQVGSDIDDSGYNPVTSGDWTEYQAEGTTHTAPASATQLKVEFRVYIQSGFVPGTSDIFVDDLTVTDATADPAQIINAYAISSTEIDLFYDKPITSVDAGDYTLSGTTNTIFSTATIDGTDPSIVHLTGANPVMTGDAILDNIDEDSNTNYDFYAGITPIAYCNTNNPGGTLALGYTATFQGIVSANDLFNNVWVSDNSGQYNGVLIYNSSFDGQVAEGDDIIFAAELDVYSNLTELINPVLINTLSTGNTPYGPDIIPGSDIEENIGADTNPAEAWEGQLVRIEDVTIESYGDFDYRCSWSDSKATYYFHLGDNVAYQYGGLIITEGVTYDAIVGVVDWEYDSLFYRINPRYQADIVGAGLDAYQLAIVSVNNGVNPYTNNDFDVVVEVQDINGDPTVVTGDDVDFFFETNGGDIGNVDFVAATTTTGTIPIGSGQVTVSGVQMAPAGTNVTIIVKDEAPINGLIQGTSDLFDVVDLTIPDLFITEIMNNPTSAQDSDGEWFEVYNNSPNPVDMTGWFMNDSASNYHTIAGPLTVPAYGFAVLGNNADMLTNGGYTCDYEYPNNFYLGNSNDKLILILPDGLTEVNRVEWDNGATFPDPSGKSMSFNGFPTEDNNDGSLWVYTAFREGTYDNTGTDRGSPGENGYDQILEGGFKLDLKVFLESPYEGSEVMSNYFRANGELPLAHPFNPNLPYYGNYSPVWEFTGHDTLTYIPYPTTDWLLIELRNATSAGAADGESMVEQIPALLTDTGTIVSMNGSGPLLIKSTFTQGMYVVVWSINHLGIMSSVGLSSVDGTTETYDFSTGSGQVYLGATDGYKELETGIWGMISGDVNGDKTINDSDKVDGWESDAGEAGYKGSNLFIDGQINNLDKNEIWLLNLNESSQVPN